MEASEDDSGQKPQVAEEGTEEGTVFEKLQRHPVASELFKKARQSIDEGENLTQRQESALWAWILYNESLSGFSEYRGSKKKAGSVIPGISRFVIQRIAKRIDAKASFEETAQEVARSVVRGRKSLDDYPNLVDAESQETSGLKEKKKPTVEQAFLSKYIMTTKADRRHQRVYEGEMLKCLVSIEGGMSIPEAAKKYNLAERTVRDYLADMLKEKKVIDAEYDNVDEGFIVHVAAASVSARKKGPDARWKQMPVVSGASLANDPEALLAAKLSQDVQRAVPTNDRETSETMSVLSLNNTGKLYSNDGSDERRLLKVLVKNSRSFAFAQAHAMDEKNMKSPQDIDKHYQEMDQVYTAAFKGSSSPFPEAHVMNFDQTGFGQKSGRAGSNLTIAGQRGKTNELLPGNGAFGHITICPTISLDGKIKQVFVVNNKGSMVKTVAIVNEMQKEFEAALGYEVDFLLSTSQNGFMDGVMSEQAALSLGRMLDKEDEEMRGTWKEPTNLWGDGEKVLQEADIKLACSPDKHWHFAMLDGFSGQIIAAVFRAMLSYRIFPILGLPNATLWTQPLDVEGFSVMNTHAFRRLRETHLENFQREDIPAGALKCVLLALLDTMFSKKDDAITRERRAVDPNAPRCSGNNMIVSFRRAGIIVDGKGVLRADPECVHQRMKSMSLAFAAARGYHRSPQREKTEAEKDVLLGQNMKQTIDAIPPQHPHLKKRCQAIYDIFCMKGVVPEVAAEAMKEVASSGLEASVSAVEYHRNMRDTKKGEQAMSCLIFDVQNLVRVLVALDIPPAAYLPAELLHFAAVKEPESRIPVSSQALKATVKRLPRTVDGEARMNMRVLNASVGLDVDIEVQVVLQKLTEQQPSHKKEGWMHSTTGTIADRAVRIKFLELLVKSMHEVITKLQHQLHTPERPGTAHLTRQLVLQKMSPEEREKQESWWNINTEIFDEHVKSLVQDGMLMDSIAQSVEASKGLAKGLGSISDQTSDLHYSLRGILPHAPPQAAPLLVRASQLRKRSKRAAELAAQLQVEMDAVRKEAAEVQQLAASNLEEGMLPEKEENEEVVEESEVVKKIHRTERNITAARHLALEMFDSRLHQSVMRAYHIPQERQVVEKHLEEEEAAPMEVDPKVVESYPKRSRPDDVDRESKIRRKA